MTGVSRIIDKIENVGIASNVDFFVDTKGLNCLMKVEGGDVLIKLSSKSNATFLLKDGEELDFCGKICYIQGSGNPAVYLLYYHTL